MSVGINELPPEGMQLGGVALAGDAERGTRTTEGLSLLFTTAGITVQGPQPQIERLLVWSGLDSAICGEKIVLPDGRDAAVMELTSGGQSIRFLLPADAVTPGQAAYLDQALPAWLTRYKGLTPDDVSAGGAGALPPSPHGAAFDAAIGGPTAPAPPGGPAPATTDRPDRTAAVAAAGVAAAGVAAAGAAGFNGAPDAARPPATGAEHSARIEPVATSSAAPDHAHPSPTCPDSATMGVPAITTSAPSPSTAAPTPGPAQAPSPPTPVSPQAPSPPAPVSAESPAAPASHVGAGTPQVSGDATHAGPRLGGGTATAATSDAGLSSPVPAGSRARWIRSADAASGRGHRRGLARPPAWATGGGLARPFATASPEGVVPTKKTRGWRKARPPAGTGPVPPPGVVAPQPPSRPPERPVPLTSTTLPPPPADGTVGTPRWAPTTGAAAGGEALQAPPLPAPSSGGWRRRRSARARGSRRGRRAGAVAATAASALASHAGRRPSAPPTSPGGARLRLHRPPARPRRPPPRRLPPRPLPPRPRRVGPRNRPLRFAIPLPVHPARDDGDPAAGGAPDGAGGRKGQEEPTGGGRAPGRAARHHRGHRLPGRAQEQHHHVAHHPLDPADDDQCLRRGGRHRAGYARSTSVSRTCPRGGT